MAENLLDIDELDFDILVNEPDHERLGDPTSISEFVQKDILSAISEYAEDHFLINIFQSIK